MGSTENPEYTVGSAEAHGGQRRRLTLLRSPPQHDAFGETPMSLEEIMRTNFAQMMETMLKDRYLPRKFYPRNATFEPSIDGTETVIRMLTIQITSPVDFSPFLAVSSQVIDEAYSLTISKEGVAVITTTSAAGGIHALHSFEQLFYGHTQSTSILYTPYAPVDIVDAPRFQHRGLNLDIARNPIPPSDVLRVIDTMATTKLNRLHIHAADAQSWPLDIPSLPELALYGAYDPSQIWTVNDLRQVQHHGRLQGIEVFVEVDLPGHTTSISNAYPDLITAVSKEPWIEYAAEPPSGQLKLNDSRVPLFLTTLFSDLLPRVSPFTSLTHFGGDELNLNAYRFEPTINTTQPSKSLLRPLVQRLISHVVSLSSKYKLTPIFWEETLLDWNLTLPSDTIIQTWRSAAAISKVLQAGHPVIFGANSHWYLDCGFGTFLDPKPADSQNPGLHHPNADDDNPRIRPPYLDYCAPYSNWRNVYSYDPLKEVSEDLLHSHSHLVLGGEVHLWSELTDPVTLDGTLWPRAAAAAEVLWRGPQGERAVSEDTTRRLAEWRERVVKRGVAAGMVQMEWCLRNKGGCAL